VRVEIYADVLCPWCFIAKRRVSSALTQLADGSGVEVVWRSYELGPNLSRIPGPTAEEEMRDGSWWGGEAGARISRIRDLGAADGVELNLHLARPVNTFDAHRLVHLAARLR
jgi:predicted DsbA family dithiol-disulfide isomerase